MMRRFSSRSFTGIERTLVAVGTVRLCSMFSTIFFAAPVSALASVSGERAGCFFGSPTGFAGVSDGRASASGVDAGCWAACEAVPFPPFNMVPKKSRHDSSTELGSA